MLNRRLGVEPLSRFLLLRSVVTALHLGLRRFQQFLPKRKPLVQRRLEVGLPATMNFLKGHAGCRPRNLPGQFGPSLAVAGRGLVVGWNRGAPLQGYSAATTAVFRFGDFSSPCGGADKLSASDSRRLMGRTKGRLGAVTQSFDFSQQLRIEDKLPAASLGRPSEQTRW